MQKAFSCKVFRKNNAGMYPREIHVTTLINHSYQTSAFCKRVGFFKTSASISGYFLLTRCYLQKETQIFLKNCEIKPHSKVEITHIQY